MNLLDKLKKNEEKHLFDINTLIYIANLEKFILSKMKFFKSLIDI